MPAFWCQYGYLVQASDTSNDVPSPWVLATDPATFSRLVGRATPTSSGVSPVDTAGETVSRARAVSDQQVAAYHAADLPVPIDFARTDGGTGQLPTLGDRAELIRAGLRGPVLPIALGGTLLALLLVGAAGSYWADRRYREVRLLSARGVGPGALAGKAVLELALPAVVGTVLGALLARWLVARLGPSPDLDPSAYRQAGLVVVAGLLVGLALLGLVAGLRSRNATERPVGARRSRLGWVPWELLLLAGAAGTYAALRGTDAVTVVQNVAQVNLLVVLFPLLFILGGSVLAVRLLTLLLPLLSARATRLPAGLVPGRPPAVRGPARRGRAAGRGRRPGRDRRLRGRADRRHRAHARREGEGLHRRGDLGRDDRPADPVRADRPARHDRAPVQLRHGRRHPGRTIAVDPATLPGTAYWRNEFAGRSLPDLLTALAGPATGGRLPAIVVDPRHELGATADVTLGTSTAHVATGTTAALFPGRRLP